MKASFLPVLVFGLAPLTAAVAADISARVVETVKIHESHSYGYFPSLQRLSTGELVCDFSLDADKDEVETNFWGFVVSSDQGKTWGMRNTEGSVFREAAYTRDPPLPNGAVLMLAGIALPDENGDYRTIRLASVRFEDAARTVCFRQDVRVHFPQPVGSEAIDDPVTGPESLGGSKIHRCATMSFSGTLIPTSKGWLASMYGKMEGDKYYRTVIVASDKHAKDWNYVTTVAGDEAAVQSLAREHETKMEGFCESRLVRLRDHRLFLAMRRGSNNLIYRCWSADDGRTWTAPASIGFRGVKPNLWLMKSGLLALSTGRPDPIGVRFSDDGGRSWSAPTTVFSDSASAGTNGRQKSTCYTGMVEVSPNRLLIVYDSLPFVEGWGRNAHLSAMNTIYGAFVEVRKRTRP